MTAYYAGEVAPGRVATPRQIVPLWVAEDGIVLGAPDWKTHVHRLGEKSGWHVATVEPVAISDVVGHEGVTALPWDQIASATVREAHFFDHRFELELVDGTRLHRRRAVRGSAHAANHGWRRLVDGLERNVERADIHRATRENAGWWRRALRPAIATLMVLMVAFVVVGVYQDNRVFDAPLERWSAGHYTAEDPLALVFADSAAALPLPYQLAEMSRFFAIDHDTVILVNQAGSRYNPATHCHVLRREGDTLRYTDRHRYPCVHPQTGEELADEHRVHIADVLARDG